MAGLERIALAETRYCPRLPLLRDLAKTREHEGVRANALLRSLARPLQRLERMLPQTYDAMFHHDVL